MNTTQVSQAAPKPSLAASEQRTAGGKFVNRSGPGRPSKRIKELRERYRGESEKQSIESLAADVQTLEAELRDADAEIETVELEIAERSAPLIRRREEIVMYLSRARVAAAFLADQAGFLGGKNVIQEARLAHDEALTRLVDARANLAANPDPKCGRIGTLVDDDEWQKLHRFESARDAVQVAEREEYEARQRAVSLGVAVSDPTLRTVSLPGDDEFDTPSMGGRYGMGEL